MKIVFFPFHDPNASSAGRFAHLLQLLVELSKILSLHRNKLCVCVCEFKEKMNTG